MAFTRLSLQAVLLLALSVGIDAAPGKCKRVGPTSYTAAGCFVDNENGQRALSASSYSSDAMTVGGCAAFCSSYQYFGVEYGRECYCGNSNSASAAPSSDCSMPCAGNATETCGAGNRLNVYINTGFSAPAPATLPNIPYLGCFVDSGNPRVLPSNLLGADNMTAAVCAQHCADYNYSGVEYGRECWCGDDAPTTAAAASDCSMTCAGNSNEICGAGGRINLWGPQYPVSSPETVGDFTYQGCYTDDNNDRSLTGTVTYNSEMTLENCAAWCSAYAWFGVEFGSQCYCGTSLSATAEERPQSECSMVCGGDQTEACGASDRLNVYHATQRANNASNLATVGNFRYKSCWTDDVNNRSLTSDTYRSDDMTVEDCAAFCADFDYFGVEYSRECSCGNELGGEAAPEDECSELCMGDATEWCGAGSRLNVYAVDVVSSSSVSSSMPSASTSASSSSTVSSSVVSSSTVSESASSSVSSSSSLASSSSSSSSELSSSSAISSTSSSVSSAASTLPSSSLASSTTASSTTASSIIYSSSVVSSTPVITSSSCQIVPTFIANPATCWVSIPSPCTSLIRTPAIPWPVVTIPASQCRNAFLVGTSTPAAIASCFSNLASPQFTGSVAYSCLSNAPGIYCQATSVASCAAATGTGSATPVSSTGAPAITNGGFETGDMSGWTLNSATGDNSVIAVSVVNSAAGQVHSGSYSLRTIFSGTNGGSKMWQQTVSLDPGATYQASWWWYSTNSAAYTVSRIQLKVGAASILKDASTQGGAVGQWAQVTQTFTAGTSFATIYFSVFGNQGAANTFYVDDLQLNRVS